MSHLTYPTNDSVSLRNKLPPILAEAPLDMVVFDVLTKVSRLAAELHVNHSERRVSLMHSVKC